eukprot:6950963-Ditylum_brightwellii.AAC.1
MGTIGNFESDNDSKGSDFAETREEDIELEADKLSDKEMQPKPQAKAKEKSTPKQKARSKKVKEINDEDDNLASQVAKMSVQKKSYDTTIICPYIIYTYTDHRHNLVSVDFIVPNQHCCFFQFVVIDNKILEMKVIIPSTVYNAGQMPTAIEDNTRFNRDTHKTTTFAAMCKPIEK